LINGTKEYDVIIVGAGPAGTTAAYALAQNGLSVLVIDKKPFPRFKLCGGLLTQKTIHTLHKVFGTHVHQLIEDDIIGMKCRRYAVYFREKILAAGRLQFPFHLVSREAYDDYWMKKARAAGADVLLGEKVSGLDIGHESITTVYGKTYYYRHLIGADGVLSHVKSALIRAGKIKANRLKNIAFTLEASVSRKANLQFSDFPKIFFGYQQWGYAWVFPGRESYLVGMCGLKTKNKVNPLPAFFNFLRSQSMTVPKNRIRSHPLPYGNYLHQPGHDNILLLGDACGLADPLLGEGIYYAHKSGQIATAAILEAVRTGRPPSTFYRRKLRHEVTSQLKWAKFWRHIVFCVDSRSGFKALTFLLKTAPRVFEELIQGQRSFKGFHRIRH
jgi:geranylgeranyl reductase family protein